MNVPKNIKEGLKIIGYFSYTNAGQVICDDDACIIAGSEDLMQSYISNMKASNEKRIIKKTRFQEIINGLLQGGAYAIDEKAYEKFLYVAGLNGITDLPTSEFFSVPSLTGMHFMRIQWGG